jgi:uncharacterized protein (DUF1501 family)
MVDAYVYDRVSKFAASRGGSSAQARERTEAYLANLERGMEIEGRRFEAGLQDLGSSLLDRSIKAVELMRLGLSRCAMLGIPGGWDSHGDVTVQAPQWDEFFYCLANLMDYLQRTPGTSTKWLIDEVVVVAMSEFGRTPLVNGSGGKDHWPYNSALVCGSGVAGNQVIGSTDDYLIGMPTDFSTGKASSSGDIIGSEHLGTAILKIAGVDPANYLPGVQVLDSLVRS